MFSDSSTFPSPKSANTTIGLDSNVDSGLADSSATSQVIQKAKSYKAKQRRRHSISPVQCFTLTTNSELKVKLAVKKQEALEEALLECEHVIKSIPNYHFSSSDQDGNLALSALSSMLWEEPRLNGFNHMHDSSNCNIPIPMFATNNANDINCRESELATENVYQDKYSHSSSSRHQSSHPQGLPMGCPPSSSSSCCYFAMDVSSCDGLQRDTSEGPPLQLRYSSSAPETPDFSTDHLVKFLDSLVVPQLE